MTDFRLPQSLIPSGNDKSRTPEEILATEVICRAISDAVGGRQFITQEQSRGARKWIFSDSKRYRGFYWWAGWIVDEPQELMIKLRKMVIEMRSGEGDCSPLRPKGKPRRVAI